jgi:hypothetical protein
MDWELLKYLKRNLDIWRPPSQQKKYWTVLWFFRTLAVWKGGFIGQTMRVKRRTLSGKICMFSLVTCTNGRQQKHHLE